MNFIEWIRQPWPWYVAGPLIGLVVPLLLVLGNKTFGVSSTLRHICAACIPGNISYFKYDWKKETWNLFFVGGILIGGFIAANLFQSPKPAPLNPKLVSELQQYGIYNLREVLPPELFNWSTLFTLKGLIMIIVGGFLVGFGTRYAGGCTSGHSIMGLSNLQWPSLVATLAFFTGGLIVANFILPYILKL
jgi:uncharacterized protein